MTLFIVLKYVMKGNIKDLLRIKITSDTLTRKSWIMVKELYDFCH